MKPTTDEEPAEQMSDGQDVEATTVAFVCVQNAGRSQMAYAFAERERERRSDANQIDILTGGTDPAESVHDVVVDVLADIGVDLAGRTPVEIGFEELQDADIVVTMGCSATEVCPATWGGENRDWALDDPHGQDEQTVRAIRDEIENRVSALFDELTESAGE